MNPSKSKIIYLSIIALSIISMVFMGWKLKNLNEQLSVSQAESEQVKKKVIQLHEVLAWDSLLALGEYEDALNRISAFQQNHSDSIWNSMLDQRAALVNTLIQKSKPIRDRSPMPVFASLENTAPPAIDKNAEPANEDSLMALQDQLDSMAFALRKAELFADKLQVQVEENTAGNYLTFSSAKGNSIYYVGDIKEGKANGNGVGLLSTGSRYEGAWKDNQKHGKGIFYWQDGAYYDGEYQYDLRHGTGTYYWPNGEKFVGEWEKDLRSGTGTFYNAKGEEVASGLWRDDELVKREKGEGN